MRSATIREAVTERAVSEPHLAEAVAATTGAMGASATEPSAVKPYDIKKAHAALYAPTAGDVHVVQVPELSFLMVDGHGDPNTSPPTPTPSRRCTRSPTPSAPS